MDHSTTYQFSEPGKYTIKAIAYNSGCARTVVKTDYIEVLPPFPDISAVKYECNDREIVSFTQSTRYAEKWRWDFGDGHTQMLTTEQSEISHRYASNGQYKVVLTATNGQCNVRDSVTVAIQEKVNPVITSAKTQLCPGESLYFTVSNIPFDQGEYYYHRIEYADGTPFTGQFWGSYYYPIDSYTQNSHVSYLDPQKTGIRIILREGYNGCYDTTNILSFSFNSSRADFSIINNNGCFLNPVRFTDESDVSAGNNIKEWQWDFGDGQRLVYQTPVAVSHAYANPGNYYVTLTIGDAAGCSYNSPSYSKYVTINGPKAAFDVSSTTIPFDAPVSFYNTTNDYSNYRATWHWDFGDGSQSTDFSPQHVYNTPGKYKVTLTATDPVTGCSSIATREITVQWVNAYFNFTKTFIGQSNCFPLVAGFQVTAVNVDSLRSAGE